MQHDGVVALFLLYTGLMKWLAVLLLCASCFASSYQTGKLIAVEDLPPAQVVTGGNTVSSTLTQYRLNVQLGDFIYVCSYGQTFVWSYKPDDLVVNDPIQARIQGKHLYILRPNGKELRMAIVRRMRAPETSTSSSPAPTNK